MSYVAGLFIITLYEMKKQKLNFPLDRNIFPRV